MKMRKLVKIICVSIVVALFLSIGIGVIAEISVDEENQKFFSATKKLKEDKTVVAIVNNEKIYQYQIDIQMAAQELSQKNITEMGVDTSLVSTLTEDEILGNLIKNAIILQEAKKQKLTAKYSDAKKYQEEQFELIMASDDEQTRFIEQYRQEMGWSEKEHIKQAAIEWQKEMTKSNFKNKFFDENPSATEQDYENYIDTLVECAEIEYK
ncbi:MAG: SurA N-terminal domain-containing protein [Clostridia bacterium]|nr:SurA N-terminal domain-containing protein [Clostridia bacterium]